MPKDEFDFEDPFELNGIAFLTEEDTTGQMAECFIEEFMRLRYNHKQILALFRDPHYVGPNLVCEKRGEPYIRELIAEAFARRGRVIRWAEFNGTKCEVAEVVEPLDSENATRSLQVSETPAETDGTAIDPMGAPIPKFNT